MLYVHDGENAFDGGPASAESFGFDRAADALIAAGEIEPLIIVAIPGAGRRLEDYHPTFDWDSEAGEIVAEADVRGGRYVRALREDLKPKVDRTFATDPSPGRTGIAGFSFGGLISVYAGYAHPETFGIVGGFSGSYYPTMLHWVEQEGKGPDSSLFIDVGLVDDNVVQAEWLDDLALTQGWVPGADYEYRPVADGNHTTASVRTRIPAFLKFFSRRVAASRAVAAVTPPGS